MYQPNNKTKQAFAVILMLLASATIQSCYYDKEEVLYPGTPSQPANCATVPAKFTANVLPLITSKCSYPGCHDATAAGGRILQNYSQINAAKERINARVIVEKSMPPSGPLSPAEINIIKCWMESGAPNN